VAPIPQINLSDEDKLEALRELDQFRHWRSLDDERYCIVCGKLITGRSVKVVSDALGNGLVRLKCPTDGCNSIPMDWMLPTDEVLASAKAMSAEEFNVAASGPADHATRERLSSHLRKFAFRFKRAS
jgi:hypothetical protein